MHYLLLIVLIPVVGFAQKIEYRPVAPVDCALVVDLIDGCRICGSRSSKEICISSGKKWRLEFYDEQDAPLLVIVCDGKRVASNKKSPRDAKGVVDGLDLRTLIKTFYDVCNETPRSEYVMRGRTRLAHFWETTDESDLHILIDRRTGLLREVKTRQNERINKWHFHHLPRQTFLLDHVFDLSYTKPIFQDVAGD